MSDYGERLKALRKARYPDFSEDMDMHDITDGISWMADRIEGLETLIKDFFILLDKTEETDDGRVFHPNHISSCRAEDGQKLENLLRLLKATVEGRW